MSFQISLTLVLSGNEMERRRTHSHTEKAGKSRLCGEGGNRKLPPQANGFPKIPYYGQHFRDIREYQGKQMNRKASFVFTICFNTVHGYGTIKVEAGLTNRPWPPSKQFYGVEQIPTVPKQSRFE